ncbi:MAG: LysR family transcriptional regulator [Polyangiaceae bacterium]
MSTPGLLDEIEAFVRVVEAGSFTGAAKQLGVPKSTLSRALSRLEDATKVRLLGRSTRAIALTEAGKRFFEQVAPNVAGLRSAVSQLSENEEEAHGTLRVTMPVDVGEAIAADLVTRFARRYPRVQVEVDVSGRVVNLLEEGFDIAIRASAKLKDSSLVARKLATLHFGLFASPRYLATRGLPASIEDLRKHDFVQFFPPGSRHDMLELKAIVASRTHVIATDFAFLRCVLRSDAGVGPLPCFLAREEVSAGRLVRVMPDWVRAVGALYLVYPSAKHVPRRVAVFRDFLVESLSEELPEPCAELAQEH